MRLFSRWVGRKKPSVQVQDGNELRDSTFESLVRQALPDCYSKLVALVRAVNEAGGTYHQLDFGNGLVMSGDYDMYRYVRFYHLPPVLAGKTVLDIGTASGYFALECARRGAAVTAIDVYDRPLLNDLLPLLQADIRYVRKSIYELDEAFGQFDVVICGSLLLHLPDPLGAIQRIRRVCAGRAIISTTCPEESASTSRPVCEFLGLKATDGDYWFYWSLGMVALRSMLLAAGFSRVEHEEHFVLATEPGRREYVSPHVGMTGLV